MTDIPRDEAGLIAEARNFINETKDDPTAVGLTKEMITMLTAKTDETDLAITAAANADTAKRTAVADKKVKINGFEAYFRQLRQVSQVHPGTTDVDRARLHLATGDGSGSARIGMDDAPNLLVESPGVHAHRIRFYLTGENTNSTKKPSAALGCQIYMKIDGAPSTDLKEYQMIALDTKSPYDYTHDAANQGKTAHYIGVWADRADQHSPQSEVFSVVIT